MFYLIIRCHKSIRAAYNRLQLCFQFSLQLLEARRKIHLRKVAGSLTHNAKYVAVMHKIKVLAELVLDVKNAAEGSAQPLSLLLVLSLKQNKNCCGFWTIIHHFAWISLKYVDTLQLWEQQKPLEDVRLKKYVNKMFLESNFRIKYFYKRKHLQHQCYCYFSLNW